MIRLGFAIVPFKPLSLCRERRLIAETGTNHLPRLQQMDVKSTRAQVAFKINLSVGNLAGVTNRHSELICEVPAGRFCAGNPFCAVPILRSMAPQRQAFTGATFP